MVQFGARKVSCSRYVTLRITLGRVDVNEEGTLLVDHLCGLVEREFAALAPKETMYPKDESTQHCSDALPDAIAPISAPP